MIIFDSLEFIRIKTDFNDDNGCSKTVPDFKTYIYLYKY